MYLNSIIHIDCFQDKNSIENSAFSFTEKSKKYEHFCNYYIIFQHKSSRFSIYKIFKHIAILYRNYATQNSSLFLFAFLKHITAFGK